MATATERPVLYKLYIHLADDEWGNALMHRVAEEALSDPRYEERQPLVVCVHEHAGWTLEFALLDGRVTVVSSANDLAVYHGDAARFREEFRDASVRFAGTIRRPVDRDAGCASRSPAH